MSVKKKLALVAGNLTDWRMLAPFETLKDFEVEVHAIHSKELLNNYRSNLKLYIYENISDMPGYMRGLEDRVHSASIVVSLEPSTLATFQTVRIAKKYSLPCVVLVTEYRPGFYDSHQNIKAIQDDNFKSASAFIALSSKSKNLLQLNQVESQRIYQISGAVSSHIPNDYETRRDRFRKHTSFSPTDIVVGIFADLNKSFDAKRLFNAMKLLKSRDPYRSGNLKFVVIGDGEEAQAFKYQAFESGVGSRVMFLHEDYQRYYWDLMASLDIALHMEPIPNHLELHETFPRHLLDAAAYKTTIMTSTGSVCAQVLGDLANRLDDDSEYGLSEAFGNYLDAHNSQLTKSITNSDLALSLFSPQSISAVMNDILGMVMKQNSDRNPQDEINFYIDEAKKHLRRQAPEEALVLLEELLLRDLPHPWIAGQVWKLKGDAFMLCGRQDEAVEAFAFGIEVDPKNWEAYGALGFASLYGHSYKDAITFFKKALAIQTDAVDIQLGLGIAFNRNNMHGESLYWLRKATIESGHQSKAMTVLIQSCMETPQVELGIAALEKVLDSIGESGRLLMALGRLYMKCGRSIEGNDLVQKALDMDESSSKQIA